MKTQAFTAPEPTESYRNSCGCVVGGGGTENCSLYFRFNVKYTLFVNSYTALSAMPVQYYA
jgi:hypothetical protein